MENGKKMEEKKKKEDDPQILWKAVVSPSPSLSLSLIL